MKMDKKKIFDAYVEGKLKINDAKPTLDDVIYLLYKIAFCDYSVSYIISDSSINVIAE